jgi:hypothetical protein
MGYLDDISTNNSTEKKVATTRKEEKENRRNSILGWITENNSSIFTVILFLIASIILFVASFSFERGFDLKEISSSAILLSAISYSLFVNANPTGDKAFKRTKEYKTTQSKYDTMISQIISEKKVYKFDEFCKEYVKKELEEAREFILNEGGLTLDDYNKYVINELDKELNDDQRKVLEKTKKLKPIELNRKMIFGVHANLHRRSPITSTKKINGYKATHYIIKFITVTLSLIFTFSIAYEFIFSFTKEIIIRGLLQLVILLSSVFSGLSVGYKVREKWNRRTIEAINILEEFNIWDRN